jgi:hypothetical protein
MSKRYRLTGMAALAVAAAVAVLPAAADASAAPASSPVTEGFLNAVSASSATDAWAVGSNSSSTAAPDVVEHWNGRTWTSVPLPPLPGPDGQRPFRRGGHLPGGRLGGRL